MNIIGDGRVGHYISGLAPAKVYRRDDKLEDFRPGPILVATRNDSLNSILCTIPPSRKKDLIFIQNGMYHEVLSQHKVLEPTLMLIYFAIQKKGDRPVDGGGSLVTGRYANFMSDLLGQHGVSVKPISKQKFMVATYEKLLWNVVFGVFCQAHDKPVGDLVRQHKGEIASLTEELVDICQGYANIQLPENLFEKLCAYSLKIENYQGSVKEWKWRNGWFLEQAHTPLHLQVLAEAGITDLVIGV